MPVRASIDPLEWENRFFAVNSAIVRFDEHAPRLTPEALAGWSRVQAKVAASDTVRLDALQQLTRNADAPGDLRASAERARMMRKSGATALNTSGLTAIEMSAPARMVGVMSGMMIVTTLRMPLQPRLSAASMRAESMFFIAPAT